jgi:peptidoglycan/LPS O-acetylase OafA/YrhL
MAEHATLDVREQRATPGWIRALAFHSFGIYLLHYPLLLLAVALGLASQGMVAGVLVTALVIGLCVGISVLCARTRPGWQRVLRLSIGRRTAKAAQD